MIDYQMYQQKYVGSYAHRWDIKTSLCTSVGETRQLYPICLRHMSLHFVCTCANNEYLCTFLLTALGFVSSLDSINCCLFSHVSYLYRWRTHHIFFQQSGRLLKKWIRETFRRYLVNANYYEAHSNTQTLRKWCQFRTDFPHHPLFVPAVCPSRCVQ